MKNAIKSHSWERIYSHPISGHYLTFFSAIEGVSQWIEREFEKITKNTISESQFLCAWRLSKLDGSTLNSRKKKQRNWRHPLLERTYINGRWWTTYPRYVSRYLLQPHTTQQKNEKNLKIKFSQKEKRTHTHTSPDIRENDQFCE